MYGLVLAGGKSTRMGADKGDLEYRKLPQKVYLHQLLNKYCEEVFVSARKAQLDAWQESLNYLADQYESEGPLSGLITAFEKFPDQDWLIVACDMPMVDHQVFRLSAKK